MKGWMHDVLIIVAVIAAYNFTKKSNLFGVGGILP